MDEIGRGTSTFDGLALAWACADYLARQSKALTLFATHYFELTQLPEQYPNVHNVHLDAVEHGEKIIFMHRVKDGPANQSYGLQVAKLAGYRARRSAWPNKNCISSSSSRHTRRRTCFRHRHPSQHRQ